MPLYLYDTAPNQAARIELAEHLKALGIPVLLISGQVRRARSANAVAIASMPKPYDAAEMVLAVTYLVARLKGDVSRPRPDQLEVFDEDSADFAAATWRGTCGLISTALTSDLFARRQGLIGPARVWGVTVDQALVGTASRCRWVRSRVA
jgi:hypothetical protein